MARYVALLRAVNVGGCFVKTVSTLGSTHVAAVLDKALGPATVRNVTTVRKLAARMAG